MSEKNPKDFRENWRRRVQCLYAREASSRGSLRYCHCRLMWNGGRFRNFSMTTSGFAFTEEWGDKKLYLIFKKPPKFFFVICERININIYPRWNRHWNCLQYISELLYICLYCGRNFQCTFKHRRKIKHLFELGAILSMLFCFAQLNPAYSSFVFVERKGRKREQSS